MLEINKYLEYYKKLPHLFRYNENINIIIDEAELKEYANKFNCKLGVVFENKYFSVVVDLIENSKGIRYTYTRIINKNDYNGVVIVPILENKIVFLKQFRHGTREYEIELPRGFSESSRTIEDNAKKEIYEELGASTTNMKYLGNVISDTGLSGGLVHIFSCDIDSVHKLSADEGIENTIQLSFQEIEDLIDENRIRDCFSLSAIYKLMISKKHDRGLENVLRFT